MSKFYGVTVVRDNGITDHYLILAESRHGALLEAEDSIRDQVVSIEIIDAKDLIVDQYNGLVMLCTGG